MGFDEYLPADILGLYEVYDFKHAAAILKNEFPDQYSDVCDSLREFYIKPEDVVKSGGNESRIPKRFSDILRPKGWDEGQLSAKFVVDDTEVSKNTHKIDFVKGRVAFDLEWNSKDQTFDRDLYAFRAFFEYDRISLGILVTRSRQLENWFNSLGEFTDKYGTKRKVKSKFGASTTHLGKLLPRLDAGRNGGCPVLVFGITTNSVLI